MPDNRDFLIHYGVRGQKKGVRRYQDEDMKLTPLGREHYGIGQAREPGARRFMDQTAQLKSRASGIVKARIRRKIEEKRGPGHLSDDELQARIKRLRSESEYVRLQREVYGNGKQGGGGGKKGGDKKHPYLAKALLLPIATAVGVGTAAIAKEKVTAFMDHRANDRLKSFMNAAKTSTSEAGLSRLLESARRSAESAGHPIKDMPNVSAIVNSNIMKQAIPHAVKNANKGRQFLNNYSKSSFSQISRRTVSNYIPHNRGSKWRTIVRT